VSLKLAELDMGDAGCPSCAYAVEKLGRKLPGVRDVHVDIAAHRISVLFGGDEGVLDRIRELVSKMGHDAVVRAIREVPENCVSLEEVNG
jgi:copper chaperone CopZ